MINPKRILIVDDDENNRELLEAMVESFGYEFETARDGTESIVKIKNMDFDLVLMDIMMPGMNGYEATRQIREDQKYSELPIIMTTALNHKEDRLRAVEAGANDFISKPVDKTELQVRTTSLLKMKEAQDAVKSYQEELERKVVQRTSQLNQSLKESVEAQRKAYEAHVDMIKRLSVVAEYKDEGAEDHIDRVSDCCTLLAMKLHLTPHEIDTICLASRLHDVGKSGIPDAILLKKDKLDNAELEIMKQHTAIGGRILHGSPSELAQAGEVIALSHHEKWDGSGYPKGLAGENIPLYGRICAVADMFDLLINGRPPYEESLSSEEALEIMKKERGKHFEPKLFDLLTENLKAVSAIQEKYKC